MKLNVSSNWLQWFDYAFIPKNLQVLYISDNRIQDLGNYYTSSRENLYSEGHVQFLPQKYYLGQFLSMAVPVPLPGTLYPTLPELA